MCTKQRTDGHAKNSPGIHCKGSSAHVSTITANRGNHRHLHIQNVWIFSIIIIILVFSFMLWSSSSLYGFQ